MYWDISARPLKDVISMEISMAAVFSTIKLLKLISIIKHYAFKNPLQVIYTKFCSKVLSTAGTRLQTVICLFYYVLDSLQTPFSLQSFSALNYKFWGEILTYFHADLFYSKHTCFESASGCLFH